MKTLSKKQVIDFIRDEIDGSNSIVSANNSSGLDISFWTEDRIDDIDRLQFDGIAEEVLVDIIKSGYYEEGCTVYQFSEQKSNGTEYVIQVLTY